MCVGVWRYCTCWYEYSMRYTVYGKTFEGENFRGFLGFSANRKSFPFNHLPCTVHNGMDLMHRENFPVNSAFCAQPRKFSSSKVLPYTVISQTSLKITKVSYLLHSFNKTSASVLSLKFRYFELKNKFLIV